MNKTRNVLKATLATAATGAALLIPAMPAGATPVPAGSVPSGLPCGDSTDSNWQTRYWLNCETHSVKVTANYIDGWHSTDCIAAGGVGSFDNAGLLLLIKEGDNC